MPIQKIYDLTLQLEQWIGQYQQTEREEWIKRLQDLLAKRETFIQQQSKTLTDKERVLAVSINEKNEKINQNLLAIKQDIVNDMTAFKHRKRTVNRYRRPFSGPTRDGMFLDKRE